MSLDIHKDPARFGHFERALEMDRMICREFGFPFDDKKPEHTNICGLNGAFPEIAPASFLEGFMTALAFCSGVISGGKLREWSSWLPKDADRMMLNNFAKSCMERQTLWDKNPEETPVRQDAPGPENKEKK